MFDTQQSALGVLLFPLCDVVKCFQAGCQLGDAIIGNLLGAEVRLAVTGAKDLRSSKKCMDTGSIQMFADFIVDFLRHSAQKIRHSVGLF